MLVTLFSLVFLNRLPFAANGAATAAKAAMFATGLCFKYAAAVSVAIAGRRLAPDRLRKMASAWRQDWIMIVIHIGLAKSGSTSIQSFLSVNEEALRRLSVDYPPVGRQKRKDHHNFVSELKGRKNFDPTLGTLSHLKEYWRANTFETMIISSEIFEKLAVTQIEYLGEILGELHHTFRIILIVRDLIAILPSSYAQKVRYGLKTYDFDAFFDERIAETRVNYFETAKGWAEVFGWENLRVRVLDSGHLINGDLIDDFLTTADLNPSDPRLHSLPRPGRFNEANGWKMLEATRALYGDRHGLDSRHPLAISVASAKRKYARKGIERAALEVGDRWGWTKDKGRYLTRPQAQRSLDIYQTALFALNDHLTEKLPLPLDLDARGFVEREFLPDATEIPAEELREFYDEVGARLAEQRDLAKADRRNQRAVSTARGSVA